MWPKVCIIVLNWNGKKDTFECLKSLEHLEYLNYEVIVVDDGSNDSTWDVISNFSKNFNKEIKGMRLAKNYGQTAAIQAGFKESCGDVIVVMDADGQNDPRDIPRLIAAIENGYDVVSGWRYKRKDPFLRVIASWLGNLLVRRTCGLKLHDIGCSLKAYRREWVKDTKLLGEMHRILVAYLVEKGARVGELKVNHRKRIKGKSKYGMGRVVKLIMDLILYRFFVSFVSKPIYIFGGLGFFSMLLSLILTLFVVYRKIVFHGVWISPLFFIAVTLLTVGILYRLYEEIQREQMSEMHPAFRRFMGR